MWYRKEGQRDETWGRFQVVTIVNNTSYNFKRSLGLLKEKSTMILLRGKLALLEYMNELTDEQNSHLTL